MKLNRTTLRTVDILKMVSKKPDGITLDEICEKLELPKTSAYDIITTLAHTGMVHVVKGQKQRYTIGLTAYRVGINYTNNLDFIGTIDPVLKAFAKEVGKTVFFGVRSDDSIVYICKFEPENPIITTATVGTKNPLYCTSLGKAIMANMEQEERAILISSHISGDLENLCDDLYLIDQGKIRLHEDTDVLLDQYGILKVTESEFAALDKQYILAYCKEDFGYRCLTDQKQYYMENMPQIVIEKGTIDEVMKTMLKGSSRKGVSL